MLTWGGSGSTRTPSISCTAPARRRARSRYTGIFASRPSHCITADATFGVSVNRLPPLRRCHTTASSMKSFVPNSIDPGKAPMPL